MVASGSLAGIENQELENEITYSFSKLSDLNSNQRSFRVSLPVADAIVWSAVSFSVNTESGRTMVTYDMTALCSNIEFRNAVDEMIDIQFDAQAGAERALKSITRLEVNRLLLTQYR